MLVANSCGDKLKQNNDLEDQANQESNKTGFKVNLDGEKMAWEFEYKE